MSIVIALSDFRLTLALPRYTTDHSIFIASSYYYYFFFLYCNQISSLEFFALSSLGSSVHWSRPLLQLSSDDSSPAVDSDLSQPKKRKEKANESESEPIYRLWRLVDSLLIPSFHLLLQTSALARASPWKVDEGEFDYELEDAGNDLFSGNHSRREALFLPFSESGREAKEKSRETSTLSGKGGRSNARWSPCRMEWTSLFPWAVEDWISQLKDGKTTTKITGNPAQREWRENPCALEGSEAVRTLINKFTPIQDPSKSEVN